MPLTQFSFVSLLAQPTAEQDRTILLRLTLGFTLPATHFCHTFWFNAALVTSHTTDPYYNRIVIIKINVVT